ncbi:Uncharacterized protein TCAP_04406 [Tolypocladium capitatum]|uniref:Uncharacterized protein n=1 Tax=Tolypocladium capitatum TaxID=45235 RepID=A0A2K3QDN7_9HYPO|nr:Uncharacterized protein TCAP_04406 [Tolypocladium capitatum]
MGSRKSSYASSLSHTAMPEEEPVDGAVLDVTSALGPMDSHEVEFMEKLQEQEANGTLTGGLGRGVGRDSRVQDEANRRGQAIEVVLEDPVAVADISNRRDPTCCTTRTRGGPRCAVKEQVTHVFYPQPNWEPFSMRCPYLTMLILVSIALAAMQEILYQRYGGDPILKFTSPQDVVPGLYFAAKFAPTLAAVVYVYGVLWQCTCFEVRRLEAYSQLSKEGGALAAECIKVDYVTSLNFFRPFRALRLGHCAVACLDVRGIAGLASMAVVGQVLSRRHAPARTLLLDHTALPFGYLPLRPLLPATCSSPPSVLAFIHQSKMLWLCGDGQARQRGDGAEMARRLEDGKMSGLGWLTGQDGQTHCGVDQEDQEELTSDYRHGVDNSQPKPAWNMQWAVL